MATLTAWKFDSAGGADAALATLQQLQSQQLIDVLDGAVVSWPVGDRVTPGTSALFLYTANVVQDRVADASKNQQGRAELIQSNLSREQQAKLREVFEQER